jgi:hypothetical protein
MIKVSRRARRALRRARHTQNLPPAQAVRLAPAGSGALLLLADTVHTKDVVIPDGPGTLLILERSVADDLGDVLLDYATANAQVGRGHFLLTRRSEASGPPNSKDVEHVAAARPARVESPPSPRGEP